MQGTDSGVELISRVGNKVSGQVTPHGIEPFPLAIRSRHPQRRWIAVAAWTTPRGTWTRNWFCRSGKRDYAFAITKPFNAVLLWLRRFASEWNINRMRNEWSCVDNFVRGVPIICWFFKILFCICVAHSRFIKASVSQQWISGNGPFHFFFFFFSRKVIRDKDTNGSHLSLHRGVAGEEINRVETFAKRAWNELSIPRLSGASKPAKLKGVAAWSG